MNTKTTNLTHIEIIKILRKKSREVEVNIWRVVAEKLEKPKHKRSSVNISHINRHSCDGETVIVPGKVLGAGILNHKINVAALNFSKKAKEKIERADGECLTIQTLVQRNPKGTSIKIIG